VSFLDLYSKDQAADAAIRPNEGRQIPAGFSDAFGASWSEGQLFGQSVSGENARSAALGDYLDEVKQKTGKDIGPGIDYGVSAPGVGPVGGFTASQQLPQVNAAVQKLRAENPNLQIDPLDDDALEKRAVAKSQAARGDYTEMSNREKTLGGSVGMFAGSTANAVTDPINIVGLMVAPEAELGILASALRWGAIGGVSQVGIEGAGSAYREEVQPGYGQSGEPLANVAEAFAGGAVLGGATKALGNLWTRAKTGAWPTSVRDAGNVIESEANVANTNVYQGVAGEAGHRDALVKTVDDVLSGHPVDVEGILTPDVIAAREQRLSGILDARDNAMTADKAARAERAQMDATDSPDLPFAQTEKEAETEGHLGDVAFGIQQLARDAEADRLAARMAAVSDDDARSILDEVSAHPQTIDALPREGAWPEPRDPVPPEPAAAKVAATPDFENAMRSDIDRERMTEDRKIPIDVDKDGNVVYRTLDDMADEVDAYRAAADHIQACAAPAPTEEAA
jgi:hypothetical protein